MQLAKPVLIAKELQKMKNVDKKEETVKGEVLLSPIQYRFFESELVNLIILIKVLYLLLRNLSMYPQLKSALNAFWIIMTN